MSIVAHTIKSGIPGFDSISGGGIRECRSVILCGPPGSGKTTFGLQFIYLGIAHFNEPGVYISLSEEIEKIKEDSKLFGWDMEDKISKEKLLMVDARPFVVKEDGITKDDGLYRGESIPFENLTKIILSSVKRVNAKRIVIDSISVLLMQYEDKFLTRQGLQAMIQAFENNGITSILISEEPNNEKFPIEWYVGSGIILLQNKEKHDLFERTIRILKLRGAKHSERVHLIKINYDGISVVHPRLNSE